MPPRDAIGRTRASGLARVASEPVLVAVLSFALYLSTAIALDFHYLTFNGDAVSRMANGFYVLFSRDPHLAAVGFVWNPGTSIADLVPLLFYHLWTPLASHMFGASLVSAFCMAGGVYQVRCALAEWGVPAAARLILVAAMALNAMIVYYGGNGMSEGLYLFTLLAACRYLLRWLRNDDLASLVYSAVALGFCYLARNEAVGPAMLGGVLVIGVGYARRCGERSARLWGALTDGVLFEIPVLTAFVGWAIASYVITGQPFQQFTSLYGTTSQIKVAGNAAFHARVMQDVRDVFYLAPTLPLLLVVVLLVARKKRDLGVLAPIAILGGALSFDLLAYLNNSIQPWFRYFITAIPLEVLLVGGLCATTPAVIRAARDVPPKPADVRHWSFGFFAAALSLVLLVPTNITTIEGMANPDVGYEEIQHLGFIFAKHPSAFEEEARTTYPAEVAMSDYLAGEHLSNGQVIVDNFSGCIPQVITMSPNPEIFVIPNDRDFQRTLADPLTFHAHYILDVDPTGDGGLTAPNVVFPNLWKTGDGFTKVTHVFSAKGECPEFRLLKVTGHPNEANG